jgi:hypothetical protein
VNGTVLSKPSLAEPSSIAAVLARALRDMRGPAKDGINPRFGQGYATLGAFIDAVKPILSKHDLAVSHDFVPTGNGDLLCYTVIHSGDGESLRLAPIPVKVDSSNPQATGSAITYARRYSLSAALGIVADEDDDGNRASPEKNPAEAEARPTRAPTPAKAALPPAGVFPPPDELAGEFTGVLVKAWPPRPGKKGIGVDIETPEGKVKLGVFKEHHIADCKELEGSDVVVSWRRSKDGKYLNLEGILPTKLAAPPPPPANDPDKDVPF